MLSLDTETTGLDWWAPDFRVFMAQWTHNGVSDYCTEDDGWDKLHAVLAEHDAVVGANIGYDMHALRAAGIVDLSASGHRIHDVQTLARVCCPGRFTYTLESLGTDMLGADATEGQRDLAAAAKRHKVAWTKEDKDYYGLWKLEPELMARYGIEDTVLVERLWNHLWRSAPKSDVEVYKMEIAGVAPILREAEAFGALVDKPALADLKRSLEEERDEFRLKLLAQGISEEALGADATEDEAKVTASSKALLRDLLAAGVPLYRKTAKSGELDPKTGKKRPDHLAVNKDALKEFKKRYPVVADLLSWRSRCTILRTFIRAMEKADPRIHTSFRQAEARTGRMSSAKPNMQNLPRPDKDNPDMTEAEMRLALGVRSVIVPAPGNALLVGDYSNIEVFMLAHYIADAGLTAQLEAGVDLYAMTAANVESKRTGRLWTPEDCHKDGPNAGLRQTAKTTALTAMYGGGARLLGQRLGMSTEDASVIKYTTLAAIPGYFDLDDRVKSAVQRRQWPHIVTLLGRRLWVPKDKPYVALNTLLQGGAAEIMKLGLIAAAPVLAKFGYRVILVVHDELVAEGPAACAPQALAAMLKAMVSVYPLSPRLKADGSWSTISYAKAK